MQLTYRCGGRSVALAIHCETPGRYTVRVGGGTHTVDAVLIDEATLQLVIDGRSWLAHAVSEHDAVRVFVEGEAYCLTPDVEPRSDHAALLAVPRILAPMPGKVLRVLVRSDQEVVAGDGLVILEAMKMEHRITAAAPARIGAVHVEAGQMVDVGAVLVELTYATGDDASRVGPE